jgi:hypothetical protein
MGPIRSNGAQILLGKRGHLSLEHLKLLTTLP